MEVRRDMRCYQSYIDPSRRNRRLIGKNRGNREFFSLTIFSKQKITIFWVLKKSRFFEKLGKTRKKSVKLAKDWKKMVNWKKKLYWFQTFSNDFDVLVLSPYLCAYLFI
jgi:hypothetical protein